MTYRTVACQTCGYQGTVWECMFCLETYCIQCPKEEVAATIVEVSYCSQTCRDAAEVRASLRSPNKCRTPDCPEKAGAQGVYCSALCALDDAKGWMGK